MGWAGRLAAVVWVLTNAPGWTAEPPSRPWPFTGAFMGSASCYGGLYIRERTISWLIPESQCQQVPFDVIEHWGVGNERHVVFHLTVRQPKCRYNIIYLQHGVNSDFGIGWNVMGFEDMQSYIESKNNHWHINSKSHGCYLYVPSN